MIRIMLFIVRAEVEGVSVVRSYTPVIPLTPPNPEEEGWLHLMVKIYPMGTLTPFLGDLVQGDSLQLSDHTGTPLLLCNCNIYNTVTLHCNWYNHCSLFHCMTPPPQLFPAGVLVPSQLAGRPGLLLLAAGTGITPMLSILPHLAANNTTLLFFNRYVLVIVCPDPASFFCKLSSCCPFTGGKKIYPGGRSLTVCRASRWSMCSQTR